MRNLWPLVLLLALGCRGEPTTVSESARTSESPRKAGQEHSDVAGSDDSVVNGESQSVVAAAEKSDLPDLNTESETAPAPISVANKMSNTMSDAASDTPHPMVVTKQADQAENPDPSQSEALEFPADSSDDSPAELADDQDTNDSVGHRILVMTTAGPLLIELRVRINGERLTDAFNRHVDHCLETADADDDQRVSFAELVDANELWTTQPGRPTITDEQRRTTARRFDMNKNQLFERDEMLRFLSRDSRSSRPLSVIGSTYYRGQNKWRAKIGSRLDVDGDQNLSLDEIASASSRLRLLDRNCDEIVSHAEITTTSTTSAMRQDSVWMNAKSGARVDSATLLTSSTPWNMLSFAIDGVWQRSKNSDGSRFTDWLEVLDLDGNGTLDRIETKGLMDVDPSLVVTVHFAEDKRTEPSSTRLTLDHVAEGIAADIQTGFDGSVSLQVASVLRLTIVAVDNPSAMFQVARQLLDNFDANKNDSIDEKEFPTQFAAAYGSFADADRDGDGELVYDELVRLGQSSTPLWHYQIRGRAGEQSDALFAWLDVNGDGRLVTRELANVGSRLAMLDTDGDQSVSSMEIPDAYQITLLRGDPSQDDRPQTPPAMTGAGGAALPTWAGGMDTNRDGEISADEFIGTQPQFFKLDLNRDEFLELSEIERIELERMVIEPVEIDPVEPVEFEPVEIEKP